MTATGTAREITPPLPPSRILSFDIEQKLSAIDAHAGEAADQVFPSLEAARWHYDYSPSYNEPFGESIGGRLEWMAGLAVQEQLSKAVLAFWLHQRRACEHECGIEESIGGLFSGLSYIVSGLISDALEGPGGSLVSPAANTEEVRGGKGMTATASHNGTAKGSRETGTPPRPRAPVL